MQKEIKTVILGYPRIGSNRELKKATEAFWAHNILKDDLEKAGYEIRKTNWLLQKNAGIDIIPSNDFSFYDQILDMICLLGAIPERFLVGAYCNTPLHMPSHDLYFSMARGQESAQAMEMTKWFDTNYHYIVPEFKKNQKFKLSSRKPFNEFQKALKLGIKTRPVIIGPVTFLKLGKLKEKDFNVFSLLDLLLPVYVSLLTQLKDIGADWVQIDEPVLVLDPDEDTKTAIKKHMKCFQKKYQGLNLMLTSYFGSLGENLKLVSELPVSGVHVDLVRGQNQLNDVLKTIPENISLSLGIVDGRTICETV